MTISAARSAITAHSPAARADALTSAGAAGETPLNDAITEFFSWRGTAKPSPHTTAAYRTDITLVSDYLAAHLAMTAADLTVGDLTVPNLRAAFIQFLAWPEAHHHGKPHRERSAASVRRAWSAWNTFCAHLTHDGELPGNPMAGVARPKAPRRDPKPLAGSDTPDILLRSLAADVAASNGPDLTISARRRPWPEQVLALIVVLLGCGLRLSELLGLAVGDLDGAADSRVLRVTGKGDKDRTVPVEEGVDNAIAAYMRSREAWFPRERLTSRSPLFVGRDGQRLTKSAAQYAVLTAYRRAGVSLQVPKGASAHALRHTFGTESIRGGASLSETQELMGHESPSTTAGYVHVAGEEVRLAVKANRMTHLIRSATAEQDRKPEPST